jgi:hypothetical protein
MKNKIGLIALALLAGCKGDGVAATCNRLLSLARTSTDTLIALSAKPSASYMACGYDWRPDTTRAVEDTTGGGR